MAKAKGLNNMSRIINNNIKHNGLKVKALIGTNLDVPDEYDPNYMCIIFEHIGA